ncbi:MAG: hypothetical protein R2834_20335 [Rhodothermales bacterium]
MRTLASSLVLAFILLYVSAGCDSGVDVPEPIAPLISFAAGDMWVLEEVIQLNGHVNAPCLDTFVTRIDTVIGGEPWFIAEDRHGLSIPFGSLGERGHVVSWREDGLWRLGEDGTTERILPYPMAEGTVLVLADGTTMTLTDMDASYTLPDLRVVESVVYTRALPEGYVPFATEPPQWYAGYPLDSTVTMASHYAPGIGAVRIEQAMIAPVTDLERWIVVGQRTWELVAFIPAGAN